MDFQKIQTQFTLHIRNPDKNEGPLDIEARRLKIYNELFYNNIESFVARAFPVIRKILSDTEWNGMVRDFFEKHHCQSPYFLHIAEEFLSYLETERNNPEDPPFLTELAHYEWVELALECSQEETPESGFNLQGNLLEEAPFISPLAWLLQYQWPVHKIAPGAIPRQIEQSTFLIVYRDKEYQIKFMELNALSARLLSILAENHQLNGRQAVEKLFQELPETLKHLSPEFLLTNAHETLKHLQNLGIIPGTRTNP